MAQIVREDISDPTLDKVHEEVQSNAAMARLYQTIHEGWPKDKQAVAEEI